VSDADLLNVARISSNGEETLAAIVAKAIQSVGKDGVITVEESRTLETHLEIVSGMQLNSGFLSPYFVTNPNTMKCELEAPLVCLWEGKLSSAKSLVPLIKIVIAQNRPLILIAGDYDNEAVAMLANVRVKQGVQVCAVTTGAFGDRRRALLGDIAAITGANPFSEDMGAKIDNIATVDLGEARKVVVSQDKTLVLSPSESEALSSRVGLLRAQIERATPEEKLYLQARLSGLVGGVAIIKVGAATEVEMKEKKDRAEDAMYAVIAAAEEGVVEGGGMALMSAAKCLYSRTDPGELIVSGACLEPFAQIVRNAGREVIPYSELDKGLGYDASTDTFKDLRVAGIIDPAKVVIEALKNAVSVAGMILTTEAMVAEVLIDDGR
jgi:chaperonin GroEL